LLIHEISLHVFVKRSKTIVIVCKTHAWISFQFNSSLLFHAYAGNNSDKYEIVVIIF